MKTKIAFLAVCLLCAAITMNAQTKDSVKSKLKNISGDPQKITITTDEGVVTFEGDEAAYLLRKMRKETNSYSFLPPDELLADNHFEFSEPAFDFNIPHIKFFREFDGGNQLIDNYNRKITVDKENGKTKVTVKYEKNGDEVTETYQGEDAEKFLKEFNEEEPVKIDLNSEDGDSKDQRIIIIK